MPGLFEAIDRLIKANNDAKVSDSRVRRLTMCTDSTFAQRDKQAVAWSKLKGRSTWIACTIVNNTDYAIDIPWTKADPGKFARYIGPPNDVQKQSSASFGISGGSTSNNFFRSALMGGAGGGVACSISLGNNKKFSFSIVSGQSLRTGSN